MTTKADCTINLDVQPYIPNGWQFREEDQFPSRLRGKLTWDPANCKLWLSMGQMGDQSIWGRDLLVEIKSLNLPVYPVQVLDFLVERPYLIPKKWKEKSIHFWSPYRNPQGHLQVRYLSWSDSGWGWFWESPLDSANFHHCCLDFEDPAVVSIS